MRSNIFVFFVDLDRPYPYDGAGVSSTADISQHGMWYHEKDDGRVHSHRRTGQ